MSYKFTLDHTLAIENIHDMITIDISPETRCSVTGSDVEINGYLAFDGSYLTDELGEGRFEGKIPLDITLPYLGGAPDVRPEIVSFDYLVKNGESLTLTLEILLNGYDAEAKKLEERAGTMNAWVDPVIDEPVIEEAIIEPFDVTLLAEESVVASVKVPVYVEQEADFDREQRVDEEHIEEAVSPIVCEDELVVIEKASSDKQQRADEEEFEEAVSPIVHEEESVVEEKASSDKQQRADEEEVEEAVSPVVPQEELVVEEKASSDKQQRADEEEVEEAVSPVVPQEELVVEEKASSDKEQRPDEKAFEEVASPIIAEEQSIEEEEADCDREQCAEEKELIEEEEAIPYSPLVDIEARDIEIEEIEFDSPMAQDSLVEAEAEEGRTPKMTNTAAALMNELFEMKRGTAFRKQEEEPIMVDPVVPPEEKDEENEDAEAAEPLVIIDSVASQFADRSSTIKMVYVRNESETLGSLLTRYSVTMDDVWNLSELADGVDIGDCVMIKYEKPI